MASLHARLPRLDASPAAGRGRRHGPGNRRREHGGRTPDGTCPTTRDAMAGPGPLTGDDMTAGTALPLPLGAHAGRLLVRDEDGRRTGPVTGIRLTVRQGESRYRAQTRARGIACNRGPFTAATAPVAADHAKGGRPLEASPMIDDHGYARGVPAHSRCSFPGPVPPSDACEAPCASSSHVSRST